MRLRFFSPLCSHSLLSVTGTYPFSFDEYLTILSRFMSRLLFIDRGEGKFLDFFSFFVVGGFLLVLDGMSHDFDGVDKAQMVV